MVSIMEGCDHASMGCDNDDHSQHDHSMDHHSSMDDHSMDDGSMRLDWHAGFHCVDFPCAAQAAGAPVGSEITLFWSNLYEGNANPHNVWKMASKEHFDTCNFDGAEELAASDGE